MKVRRLQPAELGRYIEGHICNGGHVVPQTDLLRMSVYAYVIGGEMRGGFAISTEPPYRQIAQLPDTKSPTWEKTVAGRRVVELDCVWLDHPFRTRFHSIMFWLWAFYEARSSGDILVVGTTEESFADFYRQALGPSVREYSGAVRIGGRPQEHAWVFLGRPPTARTTRLLISGELRIPTRS